MEYEGQVSGEQTQQPLHESEKNMGEDSSIPRLRFRRPGGPVRRGIEVRERKFQDLRVAIRDHFTSEACQ